ncbi:MAG: MBL fold metallo-hydrolase [Alphaproteobacteria bacterium]
MNPRVTTFFDEATHTATHLLAEPEGKHGAIIDSVLDFDAKSGRTSTASADRLIAACEKDGLIIDWILETHAHADHLTAASYLKEKLGGKTGIGAGIADVQATFGPVFNAGPEFKTDGSQFDHIFADGETFNAEALEIAALHTPGHTPACVTYVAGDAAFVGDTMFMPDFGTARCDFPGGDARHLYRSIQKILALPPEIRLFMCHDYGGPDRPNYAWQTTVAEERAGNKHVRDGIGEDEFVKMRRERDARLEMPALILPAIQINMRAGAFPVADDNGTSYLKLPLNAL